MTLSQLASIVGILGALLAVAALIYTYLRASAVKARIEAQDGLIVVLQADIANMREKLSTAIEKAASLERENTTLRSVVTSKQEIKDLQDSENAHHEETIAVLRQIREAVAR